MSHAASSLVVLFDIDGTLVTCHGAGRVAIVEAFAEVTGGREALEGIAFAGMTDRAIVRAGLATGSWSRGGADDEALIDEVLARYLMHLPRALSDKAPRVFPGAVTLVQHVSGRPDTAVGLGTGNIAAGAKHKLLAAGLWQRFAFGGFGSDREDRAALLEVGAQRGAAHLSRPRRETKVVIVGDTPKDVRAAQAIGARCLAVASPHYPFEALRDAGADLTVSDLADPDALAFFD
ncbi:MAG: haloacid dehalogenase-like hydrolase [Nannocystaceae bacterium]|nr:haloacid dehalogenase-like hydrolase [Nannocystaceae bacterium]